MNTFVAVDAPSVPFEISGSGGSVSELDSAAVRQALEEHGAVLLRGFSVTVDDFGALGHALCAFPSYNESPNRESLQQDGSVQTVNLGNDPFPLHPELSREPWRPDLAMFGCFEPPEVGGQTNLCDGVAIADALPADIRARLEKSRLFYIRPATPEMLELWLGTTEPDDALLNNPPEDCPYFFRKAQGRILRGFTRPALEPTLFHARPAWGNFALFARDYLHLPNVPLLDGQPIPDEILDVVRSTARRLTYSHVWREGDVVLLDNSRFMHGRKAIAVAESRRIATYFGYLKGVERPGLEPANPVWRREVFVTPERPEGT